jgi:hypothetical protein
MATDVQRKAEELVRYYSELVRRLSQTGVRDIGELIALYEQLRRALDTVSRQEIAWAAEQTQGLIEGLVNMDASLQALRGLKAALGGDRAT